MGVLIPGGSLTGLPSKKKGRWEDEKKKQKKKKKKKKKKKRKRKRKRRRGLKKIALKRRWNLLRRTPWEGRCSL